MRLTMLALLFFWLVLDVIILASFMYMPVLRDEEAFFGVRVSPEVYHGPGRRILHRYWFWLVVTFLEVEAIGLLVSIYRFQLPYARIASVLLLTSAGIIFYLIFYRQVKPFEIVDQRQRFASSLKVRHLGDYTSIALEVVIGALTVLPSLALIYYYPELPGRIPVHWNWRFEPDRWADKSFGTVFFLPIIAIYLQGLFLLIKHGLLQVKMTLPAEHAEEYFRYKEESLNMNMKLMDRVRILMAVLKGTLALNIIFSAIERFSSLRGIIAVTVIATTSLLLILGAYYGHRLVVINRNLKAVAGRVYVQRETDAAHWYGGGLFYYNREDPALFVEKLVGLGYTLNLANKRVYIYLLYLVGLPLLVGWAVKSL